MPTYTDTIFLNDIKTQSLIGILPHERAKKQTLIISIALETNFSQAQHSDDITHALNYTTIGDFIINFADKAEYALLERFGNELCQALFTFCSAKVIHLTITKPGAIPHTQAVGLKMTRIRG